MPKIIFACLLFLGIPFTYGQNTIKNPEQFLGYPLGSQFTPYHQVLSYINYLSTEAPTQFKWQNYGTTYEGRPLVVAFISSEANINRLEDIRTDNLKSIGLFPGQANVNLPAIAWLSYNIHGNEAVSSEAVLQVLYDLVNAANAPMQKWLENVVVIVDPCENPDGRERYVQWYKQVANQVPNALPMAWEHHEPWPGGRPNHYLFDLNRDWAWQTQKETKARIALYNQWMPHLHADFHEMSVDASYYFSPAAKPFHSDITAWQREFQEIIGENNRKYFDANNWLYFTREKYDLFYPSYGDTWPTFNGAIGMTYEQGGSGRAGLAIIRNEGDTLTLAERIAHHYTASLATIEAVSMRQKQVVQEFQKYFQQSRTNPHGPYKTYVLKASGKPGKLQAITDYFNRQGITYSYAKGSSTFKGFSYTTGKTASAKLETNDLLISAYQPKSTLLKVLFDPNPTLEDSLTYDITSWALPYAYGIETFALSTKLPAGTLTPTLPATTTSTVINKPYAYLVRWQSLEDLKFLSALLSQQVKVRFSEIAFTVDGHTYAPGTLIITRTGNETLGDKLDQLVAKQAAQFAASITPVKSGFVTSGADFGSGNVRFINAPKVGVLAGEDISAAAFGEVWHYFEQQIGYPVTVIRTNYFSYAQLKELDVLILPSGSYNNIFNDKMLSSVKDWVRTGGKLIVMEEALGYFAGKPDFQLKKKPADKTPTSTQSPYDTLQVYGNRFRESVNEEVLGGIYRVQLDKTHPLAFGYDDTYFSLLHDVSSYGFLQKGWNIGILKKDGYLSGYVGKKARKKLQDTLIFGEQEMGKGSIIYMANNPLFRGFWYNGKLLFGNAVFLVGQ